MEHQTDKSRCALCPRACGANRLTGRGRCGCTATLTAARAALHFWEEPCISGTRGAGTVFFSGCQLGCVYCQNAAISSGANGAGITVERLAGIFFELEEAGAHNVDLVTPDCWAPEVACAMAAARKDGLKIPFVCNCSGYESVSTLKLFSGLVDIYLPDLKYYSPKVSAKYASAPDYFGTACLALDEMFSQTGSFVLENGIMKRGMIVRHMMLPGNLFDSKHILDYLVSRFGDNIYISLMSQYTPMPHILENDKAPEELRRPLSQKNYESLCDYLADLGQTNAFVQEPCSAGELMIPDFRS